MFKRIRRKTAFFEMNMAHIYSNFMFVIPLSGLGPTFKSVIVCLSDPLLYVIAWHCMAIVIAWHSDILSNTVYWLIAHLLCWFVFYCSVYCFAFYCILQLRHIIYLVQNIVVFDQLKSFVTVIKVMVTISHCFNSLLSNIRWLWHNLSNYIYSFILFSAKRYCECISVL